MSDQKVQVRTGDRDERGRLLPGHSPMGGRPKGSRQKLADGFFRDFEADWAQHGAAVVAQVRQERPADYLATAARLMPRELTVEMTAQEDALRDLDEPEGEQGQPA